MIGAGGGSTATVWSFKGEMAEILIYEGKLTSQQVYEIEDYLSEKWGIDLL